MIEVGTLVEDATKQEILWDVIGKNSTDDQMMIETGVFVGGTVCWLGQKLKENGKSLKIYAIDNWICANISQESKDFVGVQNEFYKAFIDNINKCGIADMVTPLVCDSIEAANLFEDNSVDYIFFDDNHNYPATKNIIEAWLPKMKNGGICCGHDYCAPGVEIAARQVFGEVNQNSCGSAYWVRVNK